MEPGPQNPNIVHIVQHLRPGGLETLVLNLQEQSRFQGWIISLEGDKKSVLHAWPQLARIHHRIICLNKRSGLSPMLVARLVKALKKINPLAVYTHHIGPLLYGGLSARLARVPKLIHIEHDAWHLDDPKARSIQRVLLATLNPIYVADSQAVADRVVSHFPNHHPLLIPNGINTQRFQPGDAKRARQRLGLPHDPTLKIVGCAARFHPVKGHRFLLEAITKLPSNIHLALAGSGELQHDLEQQAQQLKITKRVHFLGHVHEMISFYQALDCFCLPSLAEGMPLSPLEAQACGISAVLTQVGGVEETCCPLSGIMIKPGDIEALAQGLLHSLRQPKYPTHPRSFVLHSGDINLTIKRYDQLATSATETDRGLSKLNLQNNTRIIPH